MPIYEYKCEKCGEKFEMLVKSSKEKVCCEKCNSEQVVKQLSTFSASVHERSAKPTCSVDCAGCCPSEHCCDLL